MLLALLTVIGQTTCVHAAQQAAYEVEKYDYTAVVKKTHTYEVMERISVNLSDDFTELKFSIPSGNFRVSGLKVENAIFSASKNDNVQSVSIVDAGQLTKGRHTYTIIYSIQEFVDRDSSKDMLYFDVLHPGWMQPITEVDIKVLFPKDFPWDDIQYYAGQFGVQNVQTKLDYNADETTHSVTIRGYRLPENFGITIKSSLPDEYWQGALDGTWATRLGLLLAGGVAVLIALFWLMGGRDPRVHKVKQIHPVEGMSPVEIGYVFTERVRMRDITSLIVYLAIKGYLKISEYQPKKYRLIRLTNDPKRRQRNEAITIEDSYDTLGDDDYRDYPLLNESKFIRDAYEALFDGIGQNERIDMDELISRLKKLRDYIEESVAAGFRASDMLAYTPLSRLLRIVGIILLSIMTGATCLMRYFYLYITPNYVEAIVCMALSLVLLVLLCQQFDRYYYSEQQGFTVKLIFLALGFAAVPIYIGVRTIALTMKWEAVVVIFALTMLSTLLVVLMRSRTKANAEVASKLMQLRHFIYHPTAKDIAENAFADINYYYEIVPYALNFNGLESWAITFASLDVPAPDWYSDDIEGNAISNLRTETATVVDYARDIKAFARTIENATTPRRHK